MSSVNPNIPATNAALESAPIRQQFATIKSEIEALESGKQAALVSGTNLKTVNGNTLLGSGDLTISGGGGSGTVTSVSVVTANGVSGSVATATTTPAITLSLGDITPTSVAASGTVTGSNLSGTNTGDQTSVTGNAGTATALQTARNINGVAFNGTADITINAVDSTARAPTTRTIATTAPLTGGGDLSADRTLAISAATTLAAGSMSAADKAKLDAITGTNTGDETGARIATLLHASSAKTTLVDADEVNGTDSAASFGLIRTTWANVRAYLLSYFAPKGAATSSGLTMSTARLLGRNTASTGAIEEITLGTNLSLSGTTLNATGGISGLTADGTVAGTGNFSTTGSMRADGGFNANGDTFLQRVAAASWQLGEADAATPVSQTLRVQSVVAGTTNAAGADFIIDASKSTGTGAPGKIKFRLTPSGSSGTSQNSPTTDSTVTYRMVNLGVQYAGIFPGSIGGNSELGMIAYGGTKLLFGSQAVIYAAVHSAFGAGTGGLVVAAAGGFGWASVASAINSPDTFLYRVGAKQISIRGTGTATDYGDLKLRSLISSGGVITLSNYTVATLPTAASNTHAIVAVTDGNASPTYRGAVTGGGSTNGVVYCDGSSWMWH